MQIQVTSWARADALHQWLSVHSCVWCGSALAARPCNQRSREPSLGYPCMENASTSREKRLANLLSRTKSAFLNARPPETSQSTRETTTRGVHTAQSNTEGSRHKQKRRGSLSPGVYPPGPLGRAPGRGRQLEAGVGPARGMGGAQGGFLAGLLE